PQYVLGSSLGEVAAATIAGMLSVQDGFSFVVEQARIFERHCRPGTMIAVLADPRLHAETPVLREMSEVAAINSDRHFVIALPLSALQAIERSLRTAAVTFHRLPVSHGFHSSLIDEAKTEFQRLQGQLTLREPSIPFVSCTTGWRREVLRDGCDFWSVVRSPMNVPAAIERLEEVGATEFIDLGPSGSLANFGKRCARPRSRARFTSVVT